MLVIIVVVVLAVDSLLSPDEWALAWGVLSGSSSSGCSDRAAAAAAGVSVERLRGFVVRSRERRVGDEVWVWGVAEEYDRRHAEQAHMLEDRLFAQAVGGTEKVVEDGEGNVKRVERVERPDLVERLLGVRDGRYRKENRVVLEVEDVSFDEVKRRLLSAAAFERLESSSVEGELEGVGDG